MMYRSHHLISTPASLIDGCRRVGLSEPLIVTQLRAAPFLVSCGFTLLGAVFLVVAFTTGGGRGNLAAGDTPDALPRILLFVYMVLFFVTSFLHGSGSVLPTSFGRSSGHGPRRRQRTAIRPRGCETNRKALRSPG